MKALLILAILSVSTYANAISEMVCYSDGFIKTQPVRLHLKDKAFHMTYTRTDNTEVDFTLAVKNEVKNQYSGEIQYSEYGDIYTVGSFEMVVPETSGSGSLSYKFNEDKQATDVALRCSGVDNR